jgi:glucokinase
MQGPDALVADIGGTHARFARATADGRLEAIRVLPVAEFPDPIAAIAHYLDRQHQPLPRAAALAIAARPDDDPIRLTNSHWSFSPTEVRTRLGFDTLCCLNDFTALAWSLPRLTEPGLRRVGGGTPRPGAPMAVIGPGTGLGVSGLVPAASGWAALDGEGGHAAFSPIDARDAALLAFARSEHPLTTNEHLISGLGLPLLYRAVRAVDGHPEAGGPTPDAARIHALADQGDGLARSVLDTMSALLGTAAANLALTLGARGGVFIGGGIVPKLGALFAVERFRQRFEAHERFGDWLASIPTSIVLDEFAALKGAAHALESRLGRTAGG